MHSRLKGYWHAILIIFTILGIQNILIPFHAHAALVGSEISVSQEIGNQQTPAIAFDGANYLVVWQDNRSGNWDIYATRIRTSDGAVLDVGGFPVITAAGNQQAPAIAFDGINYLVVWQDERNGNSDIYASRIRASDRAVLDMGGFPVTTAAGNQQAPAIAFDGTNYLVVWQDERNGNSDIYGARVRAIDIAVLDTAGRGIFTGIGNQQLPAISFGGTNYFGVWQDDRNGNLDIYGVRVRASDGLVLDTAGIPIAVGTGIQRAPSVAFDGITTFSAVWEDNRNGSLDIYWVRVSIDGTLLDSSARLISGAMNDQTHPQVTFDGNIYFIVIWNDYRKDGTTANVYGSRMLSDGTILDGDGLLFSATSFEKQNSTIRCNGILCFSVWDSPGSSIDRGIYGQILSFPSLTNLSPTAARIGDIVTLNGLNFGTDPGTVNRASETNHLELNGVIVPESAILVWSDTRIDLTIPLNGKSGPIKVVAKGWKSNILNLNVLPTILTGTLPLGVVGTSYSVFLSAGGGAPPYSWSVVFGALPPGLSLNTLSGEISGTPTNYGIFDFTIQLRDAVGNTDTRALRITIDDTPPVAPTKLSVTPFGTREMSLSWSPSTDDIGVTGYAIERMEITGVTSYRIPFDRGEGFLFSDLSRVGIDEINGEVRLLPGGLIFNKDTGRRVDTDSSYDINGIQAGTIIKYSDGYRLYYVGIDSSNIRRLLSATSKDGLNFVKEQGIRLAPTTGSYDSAGIFYPHVVRLDNGSYRIYYSGYSAEDGKIRILSATSTDGINFTKDSGVRVDVGAVGSYDEKQAIGPFVLRLPDGLYRIYYEGFDANYNYRILSALSTSPQDSLNFTKESGARVNRNNSADDFNGAISPQVIRLGDGRYRMYYVGSPSSGSYQYLLSAISPDGLNFTIEAGRRLAPGTGDDQGGIVHAAIMGVEGSMKTYYSGLGADGKWRILSATMADMSIGEQSVVTPVIPADRVAGWVSFSAVEMGKSSGTGIRYQLSGDLGKTWKWWNGSNWVGAQLSSEANDASTINANIGKLPVTPEGLQIRIWLNTASNMQSPVVDSLDIGYQTGTGFLEIAWVTSTSYTDNNNLKSGVSYAYRIRAIDTTGHLSPYSYVISNMTLTLSIPTGSLINGLLNQNYSAILSVVNGVGPYTWRIISGALPTGLSLDGLTGTVGGVPTVEGNFSFTVEVTDSRGDRASKALSITVLRDAITIPVWENDFQSPILQTFSDPALLSLTSWNEFWWSGRAYPAVFGHTSNKTLPVMKISATVPNGIYRVVANLYGGTDRTYRYYYSFDATNPQLYTVDVGLQNDFAEINLREITIRNKRFELFFQRGDILSGMDNYFGWAWVKLILITPDTLNITPSTLPSGMVWSPYSTMLSASGGAAPYIWSLVSGSIPQGLTLDSTTGTISGTPTLKGTFSFTIGVQDTSGQTGRIALSITIKDEVTFNTWDDTQQYPVLTTFTDPVLLSPASWNEFWWSGLAFPAIFGHTSNKSLPVMKFYGTAPNGTYEVFANLYGGPDSSYRYYFSFDPANPKAYSVDVGPQADFAEVSLGQMVVTNGTFAVYTQRADILSGKENYFGWGQVRLKYVSTSTVGVATRTLPQGLLNGSYNVALSAMGGTQPLTWSILSGTLPPGLSLDSATGILSAKPTQLGVFNFTVGVRDGAGNTGIGNLSIKVVESLTFDLWKDEYQAPVLTTFTDPALLNSTSWNEFWWSGRAYPAVFGHTSNKSLPTMKFYASVPNGTYEIVANLYGGSDRTYRYYYSFDATNPRAYSVDVDTQPDFAGYPLCERVTVTGNQFQLYLQQADTLSGLSNYFGWASMKLYVASGPMVSSISPESGTHLESTQITIMGAGFTGTTGIFLDDPARTPLLNVQVLDDSRLVATVPAWVAPGSYRIMVTTPAGTNRINCGRFTVKNGYLEGYTSKTSVIQGGSINFHISGNVKNYDIHIYREGAKRELVTSVIGLEATEYPVPADGYATGYKWPVIYMLQVPSSWRSGVYVADLSVNNFVVSRMIFVVREDLPGSTSNILFKLSSNTYQAYNGAGGKSLYDGIGSPLDGNRSYKVSFDRPYKDIAVIRLSGYLPDYDGIDGAGEFYYWEYRFVRWLEQNGYPVEYATDGDLHEDPGLLNPYALLLSVGHDEYWSKEMRDQVEAFVSRGGNVAFFSGNVMWWQVRFEDNNRTMVCYKDYTKDPLFGIDNSRVTYLWSYYPVNRPENYITGVSWNNGGFVNFLGVLPASQGYGGYTVYNTSHWVYQGTNLSDGEQFGYPETIVGYEVDGALFTWQNGIPVVTGTDGTPTNFTILGISPANNGYATMGTYTRPQGGNVFTAATTDWSHGLLTNWVVHKVTDNVVKRFAPSVSQGLRISTFAIPQATLGASYSASLISEGGIAPYRWALTEGILPAGIVLDGVTGILSGIPSKTGNYLFTITVMDAMGNTNLRQFSLAINTLPEVSTTKLADGMTGGTYAGTLQVTGGTGPFSWTITGGTLPSGLSLDSSTGTVSGIPLQSGTFSLTVQVKDAYGITATSNLTLTVTVGPPNILTNTLPDGLMGILYNSSLQVGGGTAPYIWSLTGGSLPAGLSLDSATGKITGVPNVPITAAFTISVRDATGLIASKPLSIKVDSSIAIQVWKDNHQSPILSTFTDPTMLNPSGWNEFLWIVRGYPGIFSYTATKNLPTMKFYANVPDGTYELAANLYGQPDRKYRYYYSFAPSNPNTYYVDVDTQSDFRERDLCTQVKVTNGTFEIYVQKGDILSGNDYYFGWAGVKLYSSALPVVRQISPSGGKNSVATDVVIKGSGFTGATAARLNDGMRTSLTNLMVLDDSTIKATIPPGVAPGTYDLQITSPKGTNQVGCVTFTTFQPSLSDRIEGYASATSVVQGGSINFHISTNVPFYDIYIYREGAVKEWITSIKGLEGLQYPIPPDGYATGYKWPVAYSLQIPATWKSGVYIVELDAGSAKTHIIFVVREDLPGSTSKILFQSSVNTWQAYNNAGGKSLYGYLSSGNARSYKVSFDRPYANPMSGSDRVYPDKIGTGEFYDWEIHFVRWLESNGYTVEYATNVDLHADPLLLQKYKLLLSVGHDEYWSKEMRDNVENFVNNGGNMAFFSGNVSWWQVRFEDNNRTMVCYKDYKLDPLFDIDNSRVTYHWFGYPVNRPENKMTGVSFRNAGYVNYVGFFMASQGYGDYTAYHTSHWIFDQTGLRNKEEFGLPEAIVGYETDGAEFTWQNGLPVPTGQDGTPTSFTILGLSLAAREDGTTGYATMGIFQSASGGSVFTAATTDWALGLATNPTVQQITRNVLNGLTQPVPPPLWISTQSLIDAKLATPYSALLTAKGGQSPYSWSLVSGNLPPGLNLNPSTGEIWGIPNQIGTYTFTVRVRDTAGTDRDAVLSIAVLGTTVRYEDGDPALIYQGSWGVAVDPNASGGGYRYSGDSLTPARVTLTFTGTKVSWISDIWMDLGIARVYVDGVLDATVDLYSPLNIYKQVVYTKNNLSYGTHTLTIEVTGQKNPQSAGTVIDIDAFEVVQ